MRQEYFVCERASKEILYNDVPRAITMSQRTGILFRIKT